MKEFETIEFSFSSKIYSKEAVLMTVSEFSYSFDFHLSYENDEFKISCIPLGNIEITNRMFERKLIENSIRCDILSKTQDVRKLILARAFASTIIDLGENNAEFEQEEWNENEILKDWFSNSDV